MTIEPDSGARNTPWHKRIVKTTPIPNTRTGNYLELECGHRAQAFGSLERAEGRVLCTQCRDVAAGAQPRAAGPCVRIAQVLCPKRHCLIACAYDSPTGEPDPRYATKMIVAYHEAGGQMVCDLCGEQPAVHDSPSIFRTLEEAEPYLRQLEQEIARTRQTLEAMKKAMQN